MPEVEFTITVTVKLEDGDYCHKCPGNIEPIVCAFGHRRYMRLKGRPDSCKANDAKPENKVTMQRAITDKW